MPVSDSAMAVGVFRPILLAAAAALLATPIGHADTADDQFITRLSDDGLNLGPRDQMVALAHKRCEANGLSRAGWFTLRYLGQPSPFVVSISGINEALRAQGFTDDQVVQFMRDAVALYCPPPHD